MQNINIYVLCFSILITEKNKSKEYATDKMFLHAIYSGNVHVQREGDYEMMPVCVRACVCACVS